MTPQSAKKAKYKSLESLPYGGCPKGCFLYGKMTECLGASGTPPPTECAAGSADMRADRFVRPCGWTGGAGGGKQKNTAATKKFRAKQCFMLTKQARLWYNETLYWENGANAPFQSAVMIPAFPRNYKWNSAKTNNSPPRVKSVESRSLRKSTEKMRKERREY